MSDEITINSIKILYERNFVSHMIANEFQKYSSYEDKFNFCYDMVNFEKSFLIKENNDIVGALLLSDYNLFDFIQEYLYSNDIEYHLDNKIIKSKDLNKLPFRT